MSLPPLPGAQPKSLTSHYGNGMWSQESFPRSSNSNAAAEAPAHVPAPTAPTFALKPNPSRESSSRIIPPFELKHVVGGVLTVVAGVSLWKLYSRWRRDPSHDTLKKRQRLRDKFADVPPAEAPKPSWLWRLLFRESSPPPPSSADDLKRKKSNNSPHKSHSRGARTSPSPPPQQQPPPAPQHPASSTTLPSHPPLSSSPPSFLPLSENDRYRAWMLEARQLADAGVLISNPLEFYLKRQRMRESNLRAMRANEAQGLGPLSSLHILTPFDRAVTSLKQAVAPAEDGSMPDPAVIPKCLTVQSMLDASLPAAYQEASRKLFAQYFPLESNPHISAAQREEHMREWWMKLHAQLSLDEYRLTRNKIASLTDSTLEQGQICFRAGFTQLVEGLCARYDIPVFVLSGSVHDLIESLLLAHGIRVVNSNRGDLGEVEAALCAHAQVHLIANPLRWGVAKPVGSIIERVHARGSPSVAPMNRLHSLSASSSSSLSSSLTAPSLIPGPHAPAAVCLGFDHRFLIHSLNKNYSRILEQPNLARAVASKFNLLLIGTTVADAQMSQGAEARSQVLTQLFEEDARSAEEQDFALDGSYVAVPSPSHPASALSHLSPSLPASGPFEVMRIGFLNDVAPSAQKVDEFRAAYDVVLLGDQSFEYVARTIAFLCGQEEVQ